MHVTVSEPLDPALCIRASKLHYRKRSLGKVEWAFQITSALLMFSIVAGLGGTGVVTIILLYGLDAVNTLVIFVAVLPVAWGLWHIYHRSMWRAMYERILASPLYARAMTYRFDDTGFEMSAEGASWRITWPLLDDFIEDDGTIFLLVGGFIYVIPASAIRRDIFEELSVSIKRWFEASRGRGT